MIRAVIDTNVLVSGLLSASGNEALIILAIHQGWVRPCLTRGIIDEYAAVLARPKFSFPPDELAALIAMVQRDAELFHPADSLSFPPILTIPSSCIALRLPGQTSLSPVTSVTFRMLPTA